MLCVKLVRLRDALVAGKILFLDIFVKMFLEEFSLPSVMTSGTIHSVQGPKRKKGKMWFLYLSGNVSLSASRHQLLVHELLDADQSLHHQILNFKTSRLRMNYDSGFPDSSACNQQIMGSTGLCSHVSQFL